MKKCPADLRNRLHNQHPKRSPQFPPETYVDPSIGGVPFARRLPRQRGPYSTPKHSEMYAVPFSSAVLSQPAPSSEPSE